MTCLDTEFSIKRREDYVTKMKDMERKKKIGYLAPQYWDVRYKEELPHAFDKLPHEFDSLFDRFKRRAKQVHEPSYLVKGAQIFFTYESNYYQVSPWRLSCSEEVFELLEADLIDAMHKLGAYDMFYAGEID